MQRLTVLFVLILAAAALGGASSAMAAVSSGDLPARALAHTLGPPEYFSPTDKFPGNGEYQAAGPMYWAPGITIRNVTLRDMAPPFTALPALGDSHAYSYTGGVDLELSIDGSLTWTWVHPSSILQSKVRHSSDNGPIRMFETEMLQMDITGGGLPSGIIFRESPTLASHGGMSVKTIADGYMITSFFDVYLELSIDFGLTWWQALSPLEMIVWYPEEFHFYTDYFPPAGAYESDHGTTITFTPGVLMRNVVERNMLPQGALPPPAGNQTYIYSDSLICEMSFDGGGTWHETRAPSTDATRLDYVSADGSARLYNGEMTMINITGGGLPPGVQLRESPTRASTGRYSVRPVTTGYMISSFFDVYLEVTLDGGLTWSPANKCMTLKLDQLCPTIALSAFPDGWVNTAYDQTITASGGVPPYSFSVAGGTLPPGLTLSPEGKVTGTPTDFGIFRVTVGVADSNGCTGSEDYGVAILSSPYFTASDYFPPNGKYVSPEVAGLTWANGMMLRKLTFRDLSHGSPLPLPIGSSPYAFEGTFDFELSPDAGLTWSVVHAPSYNTVLVTNNGSTVYPVEVLQMDIAAGDLPPGMFIRESPTRLSPGRLSAVPVAGGDMVSSFFDVWLEVSVDGGGSWSPALNSFPMSLTYPAEYSFGNDHFPPVGIYKSDPGAEIIYPMGAVIRNISHSGFSGSFPLPLPGKTSYYVFTGAVGFDITLDGGSTWNYVSSVSTNTVQMMHWDDTGTGNFYNTEIQQMDIAGGGLPGGMFIRESPTRASTGRYNVRPVILGDRISSFFDVFLELSADGGATWYRPEDYITLNLYSVQTLVTAYADRWNMVSVPLQVDDFRKSSVFPTAASNAFAFDTGYVVKDTLSNGVGYWVKFNGVQNDTMTGVPLTEDTVRVSAGWNMIGSISKPLPVSAITSIPPGIVTGQFWGYSGGYVSSDTIKPARAYWVKINSTGRLILTALSGPAKAGRIKIVPSVELPPPPPGEQSDKNSSRRDIPSTFALEQNYPNPFNPVTMIRYQLPEDCRVTLKVYNTLGGEVAILVNAIQTAGYRSVEFDARNLASGVYIYKFTAGTFSQVRKMVVLK